MILYSLVITDNMVLLQGRPPLSHMDSILKIAENLGFDYMQITGDGNVEFKKRKGDVE